MKRFLMILLVLVGLVVGASAQTAPEYFAFVLSDTAAVPTAVGAKFPTKVMLFAKPTAAEVTLEVTILTSAGSEKYYMTQPPMEGTDWAEINTMQFARGTSITSVVVKKLTPGEAITIPLEGQTTGGRP